jgi:gluconolactonase
MHRKSLFPFKTYLSLKYHRFSYIAGVYQTPPELASSIYRYNMSSGSISVIDQTILWPNGIAFSPDNRTLYVTNTPLGPTNTTVDHSIVAFDVIDSRMLANKRTLYVPDTYFADGLKVSERGNLFGACASSIDVVSPKGELLGKINIPGHILNNLVFLPNGSMIISGEGGIWRVKIAEQGTIHY